MTQPPCMGLGSQANGSPLSCAHAVSHFKVSMHYYTAHDIFNFACSAVLKGKFHCAML